MTASAEPGMVTTPEDAPLSLAERMSDRLNPLLVREMLQVMRSKSFVVVLSMALASIAATALFVAAEGRAHQSVGREAFTVALILLAPIATFLIPIQAFISMQHELRGGVGEQLMLSRLTPGRIVRGKLTATTVQMLLFLSVFGPLLALTFLLRGTDVPTILFFLVMALLASVVTSSVAIVLGAVSRVRALTPIVFGVTATALAGATIGMMAGMYDLVRDIGREMRDPDFWLAMGIMATVLLAALVLLGMVAAALLTHANENRSTSFRVFALVLLVTAWVWVLCGVPARHLEDAGPVFITAGSPVLGVFWWFALTEEERFSPRTRSLVPKSRPMALLAAPFLPGGGRAVLFVLLSSALLFAAGGILTWVAKVSARPHLPFWDFAVLSYAYTVLFFGMGRLIRGPRRPGLVRSWIARAAVPALLVLACTLPVLIEVLSRGSLGRWSMLHLSNPFWTLERYPRDSHGSLPIVLVAAGVVLLSCLPAVRRGLAETLAAAAERRQRAG